MAFRLGDHVVFGMVDNRARNRTYGILNLSTFGTPGPREVRFELAGDCGPDLRGRKVRFWCRQDPWECKPMDHSLFTGFQWEQIGATGTMTASGWVRSLPCSVEEFLRRRELGEPPPTPWVRHLYLEWYGQNGRVVVEMKDPLVEQRPDTDEIDGQHLAPDEIWVPLPNLAVMPEAALRDRPPAGLGITCITRDGAETHIQHWSKCSRDSEAADEEDPFEFEDGEFCEPAEEYEEDNEEADSDEEVKDAAFEAEMKHINACLEKEGMPLLEMLKGFGLPPPVDTLDDRAVETQLKCLIANLALFSIAFDICPHCTPRGAYRILTEEILPENCGNPELAGTGWIQHFSTHEFCKQCEEEHEKHLDEDFDYDRPEDPGPEDDMPF